MTRLQNSLQIADTQNRQVIETSFGMGRISFYEAQVDRAAGTKRLAQELSI